MKTMGWTEAEAAEVWDTDHAIDKGADPFPLTAEQKKIAQKYTKTGTRKAPTIYKFEQKERKVNATKAQIIQELFTFLTENASFSAENCEITNNERMIAFKSNGNSYELTLTQKRKPKN